MSRIERDDPLQRLSIVLPIGPGDHAWPPLYAALCEHAASAEIRLVFAEGDAQIAANEIPSGIRYAPAGRAAQQNAGAAASTRPWLWFLHADSRPDAAVFAAVRAFIACDEHALGWFRLRFDSDESPALRGRMRVNAAGANWRSRRFRLPFGDQGLLMPKAIFDELGGFDPTLACGEDLALVWRAQRADIPLRELPATLTTSARKYVERGWLRTTLRHLRLTAAMVWREMRR
jgi:GT2 family glycosyltransferase